MPSGIDTGCHRLERMRAIGPENGRFRRGRAWPHACSVQWLVKIQLTFAESPDPLEELLGGRLTLTEVIEGRQEFLEELVSRLHAITSPRSSPSEMDADATLPLRWSRRSREDAAEETGESELTAPFADAEEGGQPS